jgi:hypothetical protein
VTEAHIWKLYKQKRGTLNVGLRLEQLLGRLSWQVHHAAGGPKRNLSDFVRDHDEEQQEQKVATPQDFMRILSAARVR